MNAAADHESPPTFALADLDYELPQELIATAPLPERDASRMLTLDRRDGTVGDSTVRDLPGCLHPGDLLVLNDTRVLQAKFAAERATGGRMGGLFLQEDKPGMWRVMLEGSRRLRAGETLTIGIDSDAPLSAVLHENLGEGCWTVSMPVDTPVEETLERIGRPPLPPYIDRRRGETPANIDDRSRYQTVFARSPGAIAAPTAGLHLTGALLARLRERGVSISYVTLHVGVGTFRPISAKCVTQHVMHSEWYELPETTARAVLDCRQRRGRVVAVGTTSIRVLESAADAGDARTVNARSGTTDLFIYPPYSFRVVDALLTNFHLPGSTLLALVMAMAGIAPAKRAYAHAIEQQYRFYSYGDAMFIH